jgi:uncharacterized protein YjbI with pentapeptide repeats
LRRSRLDRASLQGADLSKANLEEITDFIGVNLEGANLNEAKLKGADLRGAKNLKQEQIEKAFGNKDTTRLPEELKAPEHWAESDQPLEVLAAQSITSNLPPSPDNAPPEMQAELLRMQTLSIDELLEIAQAQIKSEQQARHTALLEKNQTDEISPEERQELSELRSSVDRLMLRKAYAWAVLRWRGHRIPSLNELPV